MKNNLEDMYRNDPEKACQLALKRTVNVPKNERLEAINKLLHAYGTEAIMGDWQNGYWGDIVACYVNMGDTYLITVLQVRNDFGGSNFIVSSFGDWIEKNQEKYSIE